MRRIRHAIICCLAVFVVLVGARGIVRADSFISTVGTGKWDGSSYIYSFGPGYTQTYGQTLTAPSDAVLQSWTFYMEQPTSAQFQGYLYAWNGAEATGSALWTSPIMTTTDSSLFQAITFTTSGVSLTPGSTYVLFASSSQDSQTGGGGQWGFLNQDAGFVNLKNPGYGDVYTGGKFVYINNGTDTSQWTSTSWSDGSAFGAGAGSDLAFSADFSSPTPVPEPGTALLLGIGLLGLLGFAKLRKTIPHS